LTRTPAPAVVTDGALAASLLAGARALDVDLHSTQVEGFVAYVRLIERWNATYNLTAVRDPAQMVSHHVLDCLAAAAALERRRGVAGTPSIVDVGSGAGLPGVVLAALFPNSQVKCVDSVGKKAAFITQAAAMLQLPNLVAVHSRAQVLVGRYAVVASRAFASLATFVEVTRHLLADNGEWMAMKARAVDDEIAALTAVDTAVEPLHVPGLHAERCIVWMRPAAEACTNKPT
jgi:16S rRNA (guanine527-N7)-methyltransferase